MTPKQDTQITEAALDQIADSSVPVFERHSVAERSGLLRLAAEALDTAQPETIDNLRLAHLLTSWANQLDSAQSPDAECECGKVRRECICDQQAAEHYLATDDASRLIGLGWPRDVLGQLKSGEVTPSDLLTTSAHNDFQKGNSPVNLRLMSMW